VTDPLPVVLRRGRHVEDRHLVHVAVSDPSGAVMRAWGDAERVTHPRSAIKPVQALPLVETGAADAFGLTDVELALACASHEGEPGHVEAVEAWLDRIGCTVDDLECGTPPGRARQSGNGCSGKHAGFLTVARHLGVPTAGYVQPGHPVQQLVDGTLADAAGVPLDPADASVDGCGIPLHPLPLRAIARAAARLGDPSGWPPARAGAARRLTGAMVAEPWYVDGTRRLVTELLQATGGEVVPKYGAAGVQLAALPRLGLGVALKVDDGSVPASEVALGHVLLELGAIDARADEAVFGPRREVRSWAGAHVADWAVTS